MTDEVKMKSKVTVKQIAIILFLMIVGYFLLGPENPSQLSTLMAGLLLLGYLPSVVETGFSKNVEGILLGTILGLPIAATFNFWPLGIVFAALGWTLSCLAGQPANRGQKWCSFRLSSAFAVTALLASTVWIYNMPNEQLKEIDPSAVRIERTSLSLSPSCKIIIGVTAKGDYVIGDLVTADYQVAVKYLTEQIDDLLSAGIKPSNMMIIGVTPHDIRHRNKIWMLREAFEDVHGSELTVIFENEKPH